MTIAGMVKNPQSVLGNNLKKYRQKLGVSQEALAELCGLHRTYVGAVERGERNVSLLNIVSIARALKILPSNMMESLSISGRALQAV